MIRQVPFERVHGGLAYAAEQALGKPLSENHTYWQDDSYRALASAVLLPEEQGVFLSSAYVSPDLRGRGAQKRLIRARVRWARRHGAVVVITYTTHDNCPSINSLVSCGFKSYIPDYRWAGADMIYWRKDL